MPENKVASILEWFRAKHHREPSDAELASWEATYRATADEIAAYRRLVSESLADYDSSSKRKRKTA